MDFKKIISIGFILTCLTQLFIPAKMIIDQENILQSGTEYKFRTRPVDPNDPFRGKYITLDFEDNVFSIEDNDKYNFQRKESVYLEFTVDQEGFATIKNVLKKEPAHPEFLSAEIDYLTEIHSGETELTFEFPFDRYYMEESKAKPAEETYREANRDTSQITYALVHIKNGGAVLKDVVIDGKPIKEIVEENEINKNEN